MKRQARTSFFEKRSKKRLVAGVLPLRAPSPAYSKSLLLLYFKKEALSLEAS
jgi:hypothetical protein